jgi:hypothetical protein
MDSRGVSDSSFDYAPIPEGVVIFKPFIIFYIFYVESMQYVLITIDSIIFGNEQSVAKITVTEDEISCSAKRCFIRPLNPWVSMKE